ncbi:MAG: YesU family protein [Oscillospiraceae bacterium]|nr:YesU family protein [Oscillospiraceae bacterium]
MIINKGKLIYENKLSCGEDVKDFVMEGQAKVYFENGRMRMKNMLDEELGQKANFVYWCPENFPDDVIIEWEFRPVEEPGLAILFFSARGIHGEDIFDESLQKRDGQYNLYHSGDINAYHVSYFRRMWEDERSFHTCNLRKSKGFHLVVQGADPIPNVEDCRDIYNIRVVKCGGTVVFYINDLEIFNWNDDGKTYGEVLKGGKIGFRQMAPLTGEYGNLRVYEAQSK